MKDKKAIAVVFCMALILFAGALGYKVFNYKVNGVSVDGSVVKVTGSGGNSTSVRTHVEFNFENETIIFVDHIGGSQGYEKGDEVKVLFLEDRPEKAIIDKGLKAWLLPSIFFIAGAGFLVLLPKMETP